MKKTIPTVVIHPTPREPIDVSKSFEIGKNILYKSLSCPGIKISAHYISDELSNIASAEEPHNNSSNVSSSALRRLGQHSLPLKYRVTIIILATSALILFILTSVLWHKVNILFNITQ